MADPGILVGHAATSASCAPRSPAFTPRCARARRLPGVHKWALLERDPLPCWVERNVVLLGDACHPMTPYMAQGAASALEDAAVLARCLRARGPRRCTRVRPLRAARKPRAAHIQATSGANTWMRQPTDPGWVYGYDAWTAPLD